MEGLIWFRSLSTGVNGRWLSHGCRKLPMDQYANCGTIAPSVQPHKPWNPVCNLTNQVCVASVTSSSARPSRTLSQFRRKFLVIFLELRCFLCQGNSNTVKFGFFSSLWIIGLAFFWRLFYHCSTFIEIFIWQPCHRLAFNYKFCSCPK